MIYWDKYPNEDIPRTIDFTDMMPPGEELDDTGTITAADETGKDVTATLLDDPIIVNPNATIRILPSREGTFQIVFSMITTPGGFVLEEDAILNVQQR